MTDEEMLNLTDADRWNPAHFGQLPPHSFESLSIRFLRDGDQLTIFFDESDEPPLPEEFITLQEFEEAWKLWEITFPHLAKVVKVSIPC
jgi:hypothetical protein